MIKSDKYIKMLEKYWGKFQEMLENMPHCQIQAMAVIWAEPIWGGAALESESAIALPLPHTGYTIDKGP